MANKKIITVLYVDQAVTFGGSVVVLARLINALDRDHFRALFVSEMERPILEQFVRGKARIFIFRRLYNYVHWNKTEQLVNKLPGTLSRKAAIYLLSGVRGFVNGLYGLRVAGLLLKQKVDIVHVNNGLMNLAPVLAAMVLGRKFVVHYHGPEVMSFAQRLIVNRVSSFIAVSRYIGDRLVENGIPESRIAVMHNPVQPDAVSPAMLAALKRRYRLEDSARVFGIVGRITPWKGQAEFLQAARIVLAAVPGSRVLIVGDCSDTDPEYQERISDVINDSGFGDRIIMTGFVTDTEAHYGLMDVCVHASVKPEPFGLVLVEAMACGVAVIASGRGAASEIITDGEDGFIVDPEDTEKLAETVIRLLEDEKLRRTIAEKGRTLARTEYRADHYAHSMEGLYRKMLGA